MDTLKKELLEEANLKVVSYKLINVTATNIKWKMAEDLWENLHHIGILYQVDIEGDTLKDDADGLDFEGAAWYEMNKLKKEEITPFTIYALECLGYKLN